MITYEVALDKAKRCNPKIDSYKEYPEAFVFTNSKATGDEQWDNEVVVERKKGGIISYSELVMDFDINPDVEFKPI